MSRPLVVGLVLSIVAIGVAVTALGSREASGAVVLYEPPLDAGPLPFTSPVDVSAARVGAEIPAFGEGGATAQPFGGSGSNTVCDREQLVSFLDASPDRRRAWASVAGVEPDGVAVYVRGLRPATLTEDTRVTNHSYRDGRAVARQSILPAGTAVLVDADGRPVVRCRCGNPLAPPVAVSGAPCRGCPDGYRLPAASGSPAIVLAVNPPPVRDDVAGRYVVSDLAVSGEGCALASEGGEIVVGRDGEAITVTAQDLTGSGPLAADGSFSIGVSGGGGRTGALSGRLAGGRIEGGTLAVEGCTVTFTGTRSP